MQHKCHTYTRLNKQVAGVGDYATPMPHLQDSIHKSLVWGTMQHTYETPITHLQDSIHKSPVWRTMQHQCHYIPTPTRLDEQVAGAGDYATPMPLHTHTCKTSCRYGGLCNTNATPIQDSINKSPVWGTMQHHIPTPTRLDEQVAGVRDHATPMPHLQDSIHKSPVWGTMQHQCHTYKTRYTSRRCGGPCNTNATPTRLDTQVASVVEYKHQCHYIPSTNKSPVWRTMPLHTHTYKTR